MLVQATFEICCCKKMQCCQLPPNSQDSTVRYFSTTMAILFSTGVGVLSLKLMTIDTTLETLVMGSTYNGTIFTCYTLVYAYIVSSFAVCIAIECKVSVSWLMLNRRSLLFYMMVPQLDSILCILACKYKETCNCTCHDPFI